VQIIDGRPYLTRAELAARVGRTERSLSNWWQDRDSNGHPPAVRIERTLHWEERVWIPWHKGHLRNTWQDHNPPGAGQAPTPVQFSTLPDDTMIGTADVAAETGMNARTIREYRRNPPAGWPEPTWTLDENGREIPEWRVGDIRDYIRNRDGGSRGRPAGQTPAPRKSHSYEGDARLDIAARALAADPDTSATAIAARLAHEHGGASRTWERICATARSLDLDDQAHTT
jgi:transcriptional regulator with XRE-family HTH domain